MLTANPQPVFTIAEVATALRFSDETIRRKIQNGELKAIQISSGSRMTFRILARDLVVWLGAETAQKVFGVGQGLLEIETAFAQLQPTESEQLIANAISQVKTTMPKRNLVGREVNPSQVETRFAKATKFPNRASLVGEK
jgi:excisionase family DNA binding protein